MKNILSLLLVLILSIFCSACINNFAVKKLNETAKENLDEGDLHSAIANLESAVELDGNIYEVRYNLAVAYYDALQCDKALEQIEAASKLRKNEPAIYYMQAVINTCLADRILRTEDNKIGVVNNIFVYEIHSREDAKQYIQYLKDINTAYDNFINMVSTTDRNADIVNRINENNKSINKYSLKYGI